MRSLLVGDLTLPSFDWASSRDAPDAATMPASEAGASTRRDKCPQEPMPPIHQALTASRSAATQRFVQISQA